MSGLRVAVSGALGRMGAALLDAMAGRDDVEPVCLIDSPDRIGRGPGAAQIPPRFGALRISHALDAPADVVVDFSTPGGLEARLAECLAARVPLVSGTTGLDGALSARLKEAARAIAVLHSPNMSMGVNVLYDLAGRAASALRGVAEVEIAEVHHDRKADAPSGTAKELLKAVLGRAEPGAARLMHGREGACGARGKGEIGIHSLRGGTVTGEHTVYFFLRNERIEITHRAENRSIFAEGALWAALKIAPAPPGLYTFRDLLERG